MEDIYVMVDLVSRYIIDGPWRWDGETEWAPSTWPTVMSLGEAQAQGYTWPPPPDPGPEDPPQDPPPTD